MIETTHVWEIATVSFDVSPFTKSDLMKRYGSKNSGTIYIIANSEVEAEEVAKELFTRNGFVPPKHIRVAQTHLIKQALRMIY